MYVFGSGALIATPTTDALGNAIANPSPVEFGTLQDVSLDVSFDTKTLYGTLQFPVAAGRGKGKVTAKAKAARLNAMLFNAVMFGQGLNFGIVGDVYDNTGVAIAASITPTPPTSTTWSRDLGVKDANGVAFIRVGSAPTTGQYSVSAGVYTFAAADVGKTAYISYQYTGTSTTSPRLDIMNVAMGAAPTFAIDFYIPYQGKQLIITAGNCMSDKFSLATKQDDFMIPEFDFSLYADGTGKLLSMVMPDR